jgi:uncharacterized protein
LTIGKTLRMNPPRWCNFDNLADAIARQFQVHEYSIHGPAHWRRVEENGIRLCKRTTADELVVRLFAWFHDSRRENDHTDPDHGRRGAKFARELRGIHFDLEDTAFEKLAYACVWHTAQQFSDDVTIGTCWDADRLDLGRVGITPSEHFMSTAFGKDVVRAGSFEQLVLPDEKKPN